VKNGNVVALMVLSIIDWGSLQICDSTISMRQRWGGNVVRFFSFHSIVSVEDEAIDALFKYNIHLYFMLAFT
jgi:hypothetical protein